MGSSRVRRVLLPTLIAALGLVWVGQASALEHIGQYGIGYPAAGNGGVIIPAGIAIAPDGTVAVSDLSTSRVDVFAQSGQFLRAFGKDVSLGGGTGAEICTTDCKTGASGSGAGELMAPWGAAAAAGEIYVAEIGDNRVSVFDFQGHFLRAFGADVGGPGINLCTLACGPGTAGEKAGQMAGPAGLALDSSGDLLIAEVGLNRIDVFNPKTGAFIRAFGKNVGGAGINTCTSTCFVGVADGTPGSLPTPYGVAAGPNGEVFVSETGGAATRVSVFGLDGTYRRSFGTVGSAAGQLKEIFAVGVDPAGTAYVPENGNKRLSSFDSAGAFLNARGFDVIPGAPSGAEVCTVATTCQAGGVEFSIGSFVETRAIGVDCRGAVYVGVVGRVEKLGDPGARKPPCESNAFTFGKAKKNKKKGTLTLDVNVPGPGTLVASLGTKLSAKVPQPTAAGTIQITIKAAGKGVKALKKSGKLKGKLKLTFTPPNEDPSTQSKPVQLAKTVKKHKKAGKHKGGTHHR
jgi:DNA-binding beta-propeller fold protein YncE